MNKNHEVYGRVNHGNHIGCWLDGADLFSHCNEGGWHQFDWAGKFHSFWKVLLLFFIDFLINRLIKINTVRFCPRTDETIIFETVLVGLLNIIDCVFIQIAHECKMIAFNVRTLWEWYPWRLRSRTRW